MVCSMKSNLFNLNFVVSCHYLRFLMQFMSGSIFMNTFIAYVTMIFMSFVFVMFLILTITCLFQYQAKPNLLLIIKTRFSQIEYAVFDLLASRSYSNKIMCMPKKKKLLIRNIWVSACHGMKIRTLINPCN